MTFKTFKTKRTKKQFAIVGRMEGAVEGAVEMAAKNKDTRLYYHYVEAILLKKKLKKSQHNYDIAINNSKFYDHNDSGYKNETTKARSIHNWYKPRCSRTKVHTACYAV